MDICGWLEIDLFGCQNCDLLYFLDEIGILTKIEGVSMSHYLLHPESIQMQSPALMIAA